MFSNKQKTAPFISLGTAAIALAISLVMALFLGACSAKIGEQPPPPALQTFGGAQCLSDTLPVITDFIAGTAQDSQVAGTWDCFSSAIEQFKKRVVGSSRDGYTPGELAKFLEDNFFKFKDGKTISPELQDEVMKIKQLLIGGTRESLTKKELDDAVVLFQNLKTLTLKLNPYMKVYSLNWSLSKTNDIQGDTVFFEQANTTLQEAAKNLAALVQQNNQGYALADFPNFVKELNGLYDKPWNFVPQIYQFLPVAEKIKKAIAGGDEGNVLPQEWRSFLLLGSRGYVQYLRYNYFIRTAADTGTGIRLGYISRVVEDTLSIFQDLVAEKSGGLVTRAEIADILKTFAIAWPDFKISDNLIFEGMKIKQLLIGGTTDNFTSADFGLARLKVAKVKAVVERFLPFYDIYGLDWDRTGLAPADAQSQFTDAQSNLEKASQDLATLFEVPYDINNIYSLVHEVVLLYADDPEHSAIDQNLKKYIPFAIDVKNTTFGENDSLIKKTQWPQTLLLAARGYSWFLYEQYFYKGLALKSPAGLANFSVLADRGANLALDFIATNPDKKFTQSNINKLGQRLVSLDLLPHSLNSEVVSILVDVVLNRVLLAPADRINGKIPAALNAGSIAVLRFEVSSWIGLEQFFADLFPQGDESYTPSQIRKLVKSARDAETSATPLKTGLNEIYMMLNSPVTQTVDGQGHMRISNQESHSYKRASLSQLNMNRLVARTLIRSYVRDLDRIQDYEGLVVEEAQKAFTDLRPVGIQLGLLDPANATFATSRFREANIFSPHADGNSLASFQETSDLVGMIWSGLNIDSLLKVDLVNSCLDGRKDVDYNTTVDVVCMLQVYSRKMPGYMTSMPGFVHYMGTTPPDQWEPYFGNVLKAAGYIPNDKNRARMGDVSLIPHVIQYIEMIFAKYDQDGNNIIDTKEALLAFDSFKTLLKQLANGQVPDDELDDLFTFILKFGKPPETLSEKLKYKLNWANKPDKWDVQADRTQLAKILGYIADQVAKQAADAKSGNGPASPQKRPSASK